MNFRILNYCLISLLSMCFWATSGLAQQKQLFFKESTFNDFAYPGGELDEQYSDIQARHAKAQFPLARLRKVKSYMTMDKPRKVVSYYSSLCGKRFQKEGERFTYIFSEINNTPATRIDIYPVEMGRIYHEFWPTRIDIYLIHYPITSEINLNADRSAETLKNRIGRFFYDGELLEDIALLEMEEFGAEAEVFVLQTEDDFEDVYRFFRRQHGPFHVRPARDGNLLTRDFEIDISRTLGPEDQDKVLYLYVEENPLLVDRAGNSQLYRDKVFIRYIFWNKTARDYGY